MRKERERDPTVCQCGDWVIDFPPEWNHTELTNRRSPSCLSANRCSLALVVVGSGTEGWSQVHMEHFDTVALPLEPGEEGTDWIEGWGGCKGTREEREGTGANRKAQECKRNQRGVGVGEEGEGKGKRCLRDRN